MKSTSRILSLGAAVMAAQAIACANVATEPAIETKGRMDAACQVTSPDQRAYYLGVNTCLSNSAFKAELQKRIKNHQVLKYTDNATSFTGYEYITKNFLQLNNAIFPIPVRFDVWDAYVVFAAKSASPYKSGANCAAGRLLDWYDFRCYEVPSEVMTTGSGGQQDPGGGDTIAAPTAAFDTAGLYNREHAWPQSYFNPGAQNNNPGGGSYCYNGNSDTFYSNFADYRAFTDLHHLIPARKAVNEARSNAAPGIVQTNDTHFPRHDGTGFNGTRLGTPNAGAMSGFPGATGVTAKVFMPPTQLRGDFARIYFYMATRYHTEDSCWNTNNAVTRANINTWLENVLRQWHLDDPVSDEERLRNDWIQRIQGNRNPFVDYPDWVSKIDDF